MFQHSLRYLFCVFLLALPGCSTTPSAGPGGQPGTAVDQSLSHGYALLHSTLAEVSQVDKVLVIKGPSEPVAAVLKDIAKFAAAGKGKLDEFAGLDATLLLKHDGLPTLETETRSLIASSKSKEILFSASRNFEFNILLSQHEALNYITHLAQALAASDKNDARKKFAVDTAATAKLLHERVITLLKAPYLGPGK